MRLEGVEGQEGGDVDEGGRRACARVRGRHRSDHARGEDEHVAVGVGAVRSM